MYLIDTNILLEILLDQKRADECQRLLGKIYDGEIFAYVSSFTLHSIEVILERDKMHDTLKAFLADMNKARGLKRFDTSTAEELMALEAAKKFGMDFDDSLQYILCKFYNMILVSFDRHFDKTDIDRKEPKDIA